MILKLACHSQPQILHSFSQNKPMSEVFTLLLWHLNFSKVGINKVLCCLTLNWHILVYSVGIA